MQRITLKGGVTISQLCFGTANLARLDFKRATLRTLETAFDAGMTHFDTARLYGHGTMERIVGEFLRGKRDRVTVTTKFGLDPLLRSGRFLPLFNAAKFIVKKFPFLRRRASRASHARATASPDDRREKYSRARAERALQESLRELRTDHVDLYLLHEASPGHDVTGELLEFLENRRAAGVIRSFGVGSAYETIHTADPASRSVYDVLQFESPLGAPNVQTLKMEGVCSLITHGVFYGASEIVAAGMARPAVAARYAKSLGANPTDPANVSRWLLGSALRANPAGGVLVSSIQPKRILVNARTADDPPDEAEIRFFEQYAHEITRRA